MTKLTYAPFLPRVFNGVSSLTNPAQLSLPGFVACLLLPFLPGAPGAALFLPTDFVALLILAGFRAVQLLLHTVSQEATG